MFCEEEIAELLTKYVARTVRIQLDRRHLPFRRTAELNIPVSPELAKKNRQMKTGT